MYCMCICIRHHLPQVLHPNEAFSFAKVPKIWFPLGIPTHIFQSNAPTCSLFKREAIPNLSFGRETVGTIFEKQNAGTVGGPVDSPVRAIRCS